MVLDLIKIIINMLLSRHDLENTKEGWKNKSFGMWKIHVCYACGF